MKVGSDCVSIDVDEFANIPNITEGPLIFSGLEVGFPVITDSSEMIIGDESDGTNLNNNVVNLVATDNPPELINFDENDYVDYNDWEWSKEWGWAPKRWTWSESWGGWIPKPW